DRGPGCRHRLLLCSGSGENWEFPEPFMCALKETEAIIFDIPGVGGSPLPSFPYRPSTIARLSARLMERLGYQQVDVAGVSWGGGVAQQGPLPGAGQGGGAGPGGGRRGGGGEQAR